MLAARIIVDSDLERLSDRLAQFLADNPLPPLQEEQILVQNRGVGRWLRLRLAERLGLAAGIDMPFPDAWIDRLCGVDVASDAQWGSEALRWRVWSLLASAVAPLDGLAADPRRRMSQALRIASRFQRYQSYRPQLLAAWQAGNKQGLHGEAWQAALWRQLCANSTPPPCQRRAALLQQLQAGTAPPGLPDRIILFAPRALAPLWLDFLRALAQHVPVIILLHQPVAGDLGDTLGPDAHPLLASCGQHLRELRYLLAQRFPPECWDESVEPLELRSSTLGQVQQAIRSNQPGLPSFQDGSLRVLLAPDHLRASELVAQSLAQVAQRLPQLAAHELAVLSPEPARWSPLLSAQLGAEGLGLGIASADLAPPLLPAHICLALCQLALGRRQVADLVALLTVAPVARTFGLSGLSDARLTSVLLEAGVRHGASAQDRVQRQLPSDEAHTWRAGAWALALGQALGRSGAVQQLPAIQVRLERSEIEGLCAAIQVIGTCLEQLEQPASPAAWGQRLLEALEACCTWTDEEAEEVVLLRRAWLGVLPQLEETLPLEGFHTWLAAHVPTREPGRFLDGRISIAALEPLRVVPFSVVVLVGLDGDRFPRAVERDADDLLTQAPQLGDRNTQAEDRALFLDALLATSKQLVIIVRERDDQDQELSLSPCVAELLSACGVQPERAQRLPWQDALPQLTPRHPPLPLLPDPDARPAFSCEHLEQLLAWWRNPATAWLQAVCGLRLRPEDEAPSADERWQEDALSRYQLAGLLFAALQRGEAVPSAEALRRMDVLPSHPGAAQLYQQALAQAQLLLQQVKPITWQRFTTGGDCPLRFQAPLCAQGTLHRVIATRANADERLRLGLEQWALAAAGRAGPAELCAADGRLVLPLPGAAQEQITALWRAAETWAQAPQPPPWTARALYAWLNASPEKRQTEVKKSLRYAAPAWRQVIDESSMFQDVAGWEAAAELVRPLFEGDWEPWS